MNIAQPFIRRPVATTMLMIGITLLGAVAYRQLPVDSLPSVDSPTIQVIASFPGADPKTMASSVATPLERQFGEIAGIDANDLKQWRRQYTDRAPIRFVAQRRKRRPGRADGHQ